MFKLFVICCCLLAVAHGVFGGWIGPAAISLQPAIAVPAIATTNIIKAPALLAPAPAIGLAAPLGLGLKTLG